MYTSTYKEKQKLKVKSHRGKRRFIFGSFRKKKSKKVDFEGRGRVPSLFYLLHNFFARRRARAKDANTHTHTHTHTHNKEAQGK